MLGTVCRIQKGHCDGDFGWARFELVVAPDEWVCGTKYTLIVQREPDGRARFNVLKNGVLAERPGYWPSFQALCQDPCGIFMAWLVMEEL